MSRAAPSPLPPELPSPQQAAAGGSSLGAPTLTTPTLTPTTLRNIEQMFAGNALSVLDPLLKNFVGAGAAPRHYLKFCFLCVAEPTRFIVLDVDAIFVNNIYL
jgi:hypothetical protein